jgi:hypothetical protein
MAVKLNTQFRHHGAHPPSAVAPNPAINKKPNPEQASTNVNPSLGSVGVDPMNSRLGRLDDDDDDDSNDDDDDDQDEDEDRVVPKHN